MHTNVEYLRCDKAEALFEALIAEGRNLTIPQRPSSYMLRWF